MKIIAYRKLTLRGWRWGWRAVVGGNIVATDGGQRYSRRIDMVQALSTIANAFPKAAIPLLQALGK